MTIRQRTLILLGSVVVVLVGLLWLVLSTVTLKSFARLEHDETLTDVRRAVRALRETIDELHLKSADWGTWDDTWHYVVDRNAAYVASNMTTQSYTNIHVNAMVITDVAGRVVFAKQVDFENVRDVPLSRSLMAALQASPALSHIDRADASSRGILVLPEGPVIVSARPILTSKGAGPVHGTIAFVRYLTPREIQALSVRTLLQVSLHPIGAPASPDVREALARMRGDEEEFVKPLDAERVAGYTLFPDLLGRPALVMRVATPRSLYQQGRLSLEELLGSVPVIAFLFGAFMLWVLERQVLARLGILSRQVAELGRVEPGADPIVLDGSDELAQLARTLNESLIARRAIERELVAARDAAEAASRAKSGFLAAMSHEIRTPMNGVLGMTSLVLDTELTPTQREYCVTIQNSAEALLGIINDILDFSKIEAGKLTIEPLAFDFSTAIDEVCDLMLPRASEKGIELVVHYDENAPTQLIGDAGRIRQVLMNLIGNAIKFTQKGYVVVEVECLGVREGRASLGVHVRDTGIGISEEALANLFQVFTQADASTTRRFGGTGLGLAISKRIVETMGGTIGVSSRPREGSDFWFTLDLGLGEAARPMSVDRALAGKRVLIVDDVPVLCTLLARKSESWGMMATVGSSGAQALAMLRSAAAEGRPYDAALVDLRMQEMDGEQLCQALRKEPAIAAVQVILMTGHPSRGDGARFEAAGIDGYLVKPIRGTLLMRALAAAFELPRERRHGIITRHSLDEGGTQPTATAVRHAEFPGLRVLLAEDNITNQKIAARMLEQLRCRVGVAANGAEAVEMAHSFPYDLILMDVQMPEMDGFEAAAKIREIEGVGKHTPIIALTANVMESDREACARAGMDDFLGKPLKRDELLRMLERWSRDRQTERAA